MIIKVPNAVAMFAGPIMYGDVTHETFFSFRSITQILRTTGFNVLTVEPVYPQVHGVKSLMRLVLFKCYEYVWKIGMLAEQGHCSGLISTQNLIAVGTKE